MNFPLSSRRNAFTLVELLVVIAIIAILAAILFPVFARARDKARQASCMSNLKQLNTALRMYADDYDGTHIRYSFSVGTTGYTFKGNGPYKTAKWWMIADPYLMKIGNASADQTPDTPVILKCPSASDLLPSVNAYAGSYAANLSRYNTPTGAPVVGCVMSSAADVKDSSIEEPARMIWFLDAKVESSGGAVDHGGFVDAGKGHFFQPVYRVDARHSGGTYEEGGRFNVLFFDGHVKAMHETKASNWYTVPDPATDAYPAEEPRPAS